MSSSAAFAPLHTFGDFRLGLVVSDPPWYENCYLVQHRPGGDIAIVDPGAPPERILQGVAAMGGSAREILLTHGHPDHLTSAAALQETLGITVRAHRAEASTIEQAAGLGMALMGLPLATPRAVDFFEGEPVLTLGGGDFRVIDTPGHTPGGVCFLFDGFALTGDTLFQQGIGRTDLAGGNMGQLVRSITRFLGLVDDEVALFSGHGGSWPAGDAKAWWRQVA